MMNLRGVYKEKYRVWIQGILDKLFKNYKKDTLFVFGLVFLGLHVIVSCITCFMAFYLPPTLFWVVISALGGVAVLIHWYLLDDCCMNAVENYLFGEPENKHPYFVTFYANILHISPEMIKTLFSIGPVSFFIILVYRYKTNLTYNTLIKSI
jgi:hypothetical protein